MQRFFCAALAAFALFGAAAQPAAPTRAETQLVVSANPYASEAGRKILRAGGSAVDAAIAVQLVLSLVEPQSSGVGGGAFMLVYDAPSPSGAGKITAYEGRETAPAAATPDMFLSANGRAESFNNVGAGGLSVGVPGAMLMLESAHKEHGRLPWADLFTPAIELADNGFEVSPRLFGLLNGFKRFARGDDFRRYFYDAAGEPRPVGFKLANPEYAAALRKLATQGAAVMYTGELAAAIAAKVQTNNVRPGRMTVEDLASYRPHVSAPLCTPYRQWRVCGPQLPSSGGVTTQQMLGMLSNVELPDLRTDPVRAIHVFAEANRLAFADRNLYLGDPSFVQAPVAALLDGQYLRSRAALIDPGKALPVVAPGDPLPKAAWDYAAGSGEERPSTSHFSIVDRFGDAVAMTTSVQGAFGSQLMVGGFILNNQLTDFDYVPEVNGKPVANRIEGGKRPLSSMSPTMLLDDRGRLRLVVGSPGGTRIIGFVAQSIVGIVDWKLDVQQAVASPHFLAEDVVELEQGTAVAEHEAALEALGHNVAVTNLNSGLHAIAIEYPRRSRVLLGGVDPRREGAAVGD
ncbi:MAG TPA: gamma-glutamyltransferase [Gammaproteobacteria bacterium]|nr:gamma-glutamyltransferase [Gammaproteobacteria bacterium]